MTVPLPATAWTAPAAGAAAVSQAGAGRCPRSPATGGAPPLEPLGSFYVEGALGFFAFQLDCQPGRSKPDGSAAIPGAAPALDTVAIGAPGSRAGVAPPSPPPVAPPTAATAAAAIPLAVVSPALALRGTTVRLTLSCKGSQPCRGIVAAAPTSGCGWAPTSTC